MKSGLITPFVVAAVFCAAAFPSKTMARAPQKQALSRHVPAAALAAQPVGRLPGDTRLNLAIGLPLRNPEALTNLLQQIYDPANPQYRQFVSPEEFTTQFGPSEQDYQALIAFAQTNGLVVTATHPNRTLLDVSGSVADIEKAFHLAMRTYPHPNEARIFYAPDVEPTLDLTVPVLHISGLDSLVIPHPASLHPMPPGAKTDATPAAGSGPGGAYRGGDFRAAYARGVTLTGAGQTVGLLQFDGYYKNDIAAYESQNALPNVPLINVLLDGYNGSPSSNNIEVALDIEMAIAMAPGLAQVVIYEGGPNGVPNDILNRMATDNVAKQLSASWTFGIDPSTPQIFQQFAAQGQSYFNASGDSGAYPGSIAPPADDPFVISVGGTTLSTTGAGGAWTSETTWNWNSAGRGNAASSGGISTVNPIPSYQQGIDMSANLGSTSMRNIPDVAMVGDNVWVIYNNGASGSVGGTSCASPLWAGFTALVNQQAAAIGQPTVGFLNPAVYAIGQAPGYTTNFHDITTGNNTNHSSPNLFYATTRYDLCTGWGSPNGQSFINTMAPRVNASVITNAGAALAFEGCAPANGTIDPGETVTVNFSLKNIGAIRTANLVAVLQADSGVMSPSAPQSFGALTGGGGAVSRSFTFTASGNCGDTLVATLQLQDGLSNLDNLTFSFPLGKPNNVLTQNFDSVTAPALPSGWTSAASGAASNWVTSSSLRDTTPNSAFVAEPAFAGVGELTSPAFAVTSAAAQLIFRNSYNMEVDPADATKAYDGGVLEIAIGGGAFTDILDAGGSFASGGYTRTVDPTDDNPLDGRQVWSGLSGGFITTVVNLPAAAAGQTVQFKWRLGTDSGNAYGAAGWNIDSVAVQDGYVCCNSSADLALSLAPSPDPALLGQPLTYNVAVANVGGGAAYGVTVTNALPPNVTFVSASAGCNYTNGNVICSLGTLASGGAGNVAFTVTPTTGDPVTNTATLGSVTFDPNLANNTTTVVTTVLTNVPVIITAQPSNTVAFPGGSATFQVTALGVPVPTYQWFFNGTNLSGATASSLALTNVQAAQMGAYVVVASNPGGSATSAVARLTVLASPLIQLASLRTNGNSVTLNSAAGLTYTLQYKNSLTDSNWTPLAPGVPGTGGQITLQDTNQPTLPSRFYRVSVQ